MPQLTPQQRAYVVSEFHRTQSVAAVLRNFRQQFPNARCPSRPTVYANVHKYEATGTSLNLNRGHSGRPRTGRSAENIQAVQNALQQQHQVHGPRISSRRNGLGLPQSTFNRITRLDLQWHPYQMIRRHELLERDHARRTEFCEWLLGRPPRFLEDLCISDESAFCLNGSISTHNVRQYAPRGQRPLDFAFERRDSRQKLTVWIGLVGNGGLIGPFFFHQNVNGEVYLAMLNDQVVPVLEEEFLRFRRQQNGQFRHLWWAQDGAPAHRTRIVTARLQQLFGNRVLALNHEVEWPPRSPDLTPLDFFLWGYLKSRVYTTPPASLDDLQQRIVREVDILKQDRQMIRRAVAQMLNRAQLCVDRGGGHVED